MLILCGRGKADDLIERRIDGRLHYMALEWSMIGVPKTIESCREGKVLGITLDHIIAVTSKSKVRKS